VGLLQDVIANLTLEGEELDRLLAGLDERRWALPTPAAGWTVAHQVAHLAATFRMAGLAAADPAAFGRLASSLGPDFDANVRAALAGYLALPPDALRAAAHRELTTATRALAVVPADQLVPWLVNPLPPAVLGSAGLMELFGHGQDIRDALGVSRQPTDRIGHLVAFAVRTKDFGYLARGLTPPGEELRFELTAPSGSLWTFGPQDAEQRITGDAHDFCLLVTRRRHRDDLALTATGAVADQWLDIAQAYRGPAGEGRSPGQFQLPEAA
jgi:uncharacterized protein (TIGR03084 family)